MIIISSKLHTTKCQGNVSIWRCCTLRKSLHWTTNHSGVVALLTMINPDYNMTKHFCINHIYNNICSKSPPNQALLPTCRLHCYITHFSYMRLYSENISHMFKHNHHETYWHWCQDGDWHVLSIVKHATVWHQAIRDILPSGITSTVSLQKIHAVMLW